MPAWRQGNSRRLRALTPRSPDLSAEFRGDMNNRGDCGRVSPRMTHGTAGKTWTTVLFRDDLRDSNTIDTDSGRSTVMPHDLMTKCEQKKEFRGDAGDYQQWVEVPASKVAGVPSERLRCAHSHGAVRLHRQQVEHGPKDHLEHRLRQDSEHCQGGIYYVGPPHQMSTQPVD